MDWLEDFSKEGRLATDIAYWCENRAHIRDRSGRLILPRPNSVQTAFFHRVEAQRQRIGKIRAVTVKARRQGLSTAAAALVTRAVLQNPGERVMIMGHNEDSAKNLYRMVQTIVDNLPAEEKPPLEVSNASEMIFKSGSGFHVAIAAQDGNSGRGLGCQHLICTESSFWPRLNEQLSSLMQIVPDLPGTTVIVESSADRAMSEMHSLFLRTLAGANGDFEAHFYSWFALDEFKKEVPPDFELSADERDFAALYKLSDEQVHWYRHKRSEMADDKRLAREFPSNETEPWINTETDSFIDPADVLKAMKTTDLEPIGQLILGIDIARAGKDASAVAFRRGRVITKIEKRRGLTSTELVGWVDQLIRDEKPAQIFMDMGATGAACYDMLVERGHGDVVTGVNFGGKPITPPPLDESGKPAGGPAQRRAELWLNLKKALEGGRLKLPDSPSLLADLVAPRFRYNSSGQIQLESKEDMRRRGLPSTDEGDAVCLCFSEPDGSPLVRVKPRGFERGAINYPRMANA
jgi:hypothetical protein